MSVTHTHAAITTTKIKNSSSTLEVSRAPCQSAPPRPPRPALGTHWPAFCYCMLDLSSHLQWNHSVSNLGAWLLLLSIWFWRIHAFAFSVVHSLKVAFPCVDVPHSVGPFTCWRNFRGFFPRILGVYKESCHAYLCTGFLGSYVCISLGKILESGTAGWVYV